MLTKRQHQVLAFIDDEIRKTGYCPSYDEIAANLSISSISGIHRLITGLEDRGFIRRIHGKPRSIEVIKMPGSVHNRNDKAIIDLVAATRDALTMLNESCDPAIRTVARNLSKVMAVLEEHDD